MLKQLPPNPSFSPSPLSYSNSSLIVWLFFCFAFRAALFSLPEVDALLAKQQALEAAAALKQRRLSTGESGLAELLAEASQSAERARVGKEVSAKTRAAHAAGYAGGIMGKGVNFGESASAAASLEKQVSPRQQQRRQQRQQQQQRRQQWQQQQRRRQQQQWRRRRLLR